MNPINVTHIVVLANPGMFNSPFQFEITFECTQALEDDLHWKVVYVGSAESTKFDQLLEDVYVGPVVKGQRQKFVFQAPPPDFTKIPTQDLLGVTVVLVTCSYKEREFIRVGYYVNNFYSDAQLQQNPPEVHNPAAIHREILAQKPRVTRFPIPWDNPVTSAQANTPGGSMGPGMAQAASAAATATASARGNATDEEDLDMMDDDIDMDDDEEDDEMEEDENREINLEADEQAQRQWAANQGAAAAAPVAVAQ